MLKNFDFRYKLSIGEKFKSVLKTIATIGLSTSLMLGATFGISACGKKTPSAEIDPPNQETPMEPDEPTKPDEPIKPDQPDTPDQPENPDEPTKPDPDQPIDPDAPSKPDQPENPEQPEEPFSLNAMTFNKIIENITPTLMIMAQTLSGKNVSVDKFYDFYLTKNTETGFVDTIGATYSETSEQKGRSFIWGTITLPVAEDLTLESLSKSAPEYRIKDTIVRSKYGFNTSPEKEAQFSDVAYLIETQLYDNYNSAEWIAWRGESGLIRNVNLTMCYENGHIKQVGCYVYHNNFEYSFVESVKENFVGKEPSENTYDMYIEEYQLPEGFINIRNTLKSFEGDNEK